MGGKAMLLVTNDEGFNEISNYDDTTSKVEDIPTAIIRKSDGDIIKDYIRMNPSNYKDVIMTMQFHSVKINKNNLPTIP